jgi:16S rRNA (cytidine1402-2'-O)-methyltransferase
MIYFVPVPIGNLEDITLRAIRLLKTVDFVLVEDGRVTAKLYQKLDILTHPPFINIVHNNRFNVRQIEEIFVRIQQNPEISVAVVSDAGSPGLSDPGFEVVALAQQMELEFTVLPGANALVPAVVASGLVGKNFKFVGFLPLKKGRQTILQSFKTAEEPVVFYESVHRIRKTIAYLQEILEPTRRVFIGRELTKQFEQYWGGEIGTINVDEIVEKGEFVVIVDKQ